MSKIYKSFSLFFAFVILFVSITAENYSTLLTTISHKADFGFNGYFLSVNKPDFSFLNLQEKVTIVSVKDLPVSGPRKHLTSLYSASLTPEIKLFGFNFLPASYSNKVTCNLPVADIIFPFQYFW